MSCYAFLYFDCVETFLHAAESQKKTVYFHFAVKTSDLTAVVFFQSSSSFSPPLRYETGAYSRSLKQGDTNTLEGVLYTFFSYRPKSLDDWFSFVELPTEIIISYFMRFIVILVVLCTNISLTNTWPAGMNLIVLQDQWQNVFSFLSRVNYS
jgi:hypothetical protein